MGCDFVSVVRSFFLLLSVSLTFSYSWEEGEHKYNVRAMRRIGWKKEGCMGINKVEFYIYSSLTLTLAFSCFHLFIISIKLYPLTHPSMHPLNCSTMLEPFSKRSP